MSAMSALQSRQKAAILKRIATKAQHAARAENVEIWDIDGESYIDFAAGIALPNAGHQHPALLPAVSGNAEAFTHTCFHVAPYESYICLAKRLNGLTPGV